MFVTGCLLQACDSCFGSFSVSNGCTWL